jgi:hypothetical protein
MMRLARIRRIGKMRFPRPCRPIPRSATVLVLALLALPLVSSAQTPAPIPDVPTLLDQVRAHQRQMDAVQENYTFHETDVVRELNKNGSVKKTETDEYEIFYVNTHEVRRLIRKDGKDLDPDQQKKEQDRVAKYVQKAVQTPPGQAPNGEIVISVSRILAMCKVSAPRRVMLDGRSTIAFDFTGDPHAKAHGIAEEAARHTSGTVWIDEQDREVRRMVARLDSKVHAGFGMLSLGPGSNLTFDQKLVNNELWLPTGADIYLIGHAIGIFGFRGDVQVTDNDYRKFRAVAQQQPGVTVAPPSAPPH